MEKKYFDALMRSAHEMVAIENGEIVAPQERVHRLPLPKGKKINNEIESCDEKRGDI